MKWPILIALFTICFHQAQDKSGLLDKTETLNTLQTNRDLELSNTEKIFQKIEKCILSGDQAGFEKEIGNIISITIGSGEHGYYSSSQAVSVLTNYFSSKKPIYFKFTKINNSEPSPFATGRFIYVQKGIQGSVQIYISLTRQDSKWVVNQFNIY